MIEPVWRSPWISASGAFRNFSFRRETATCRSRSSRKAAAVGVEPRLRPAVLLGHAIGIGEDQVLGDLAQRMVAGERRDPLLLLGGGKREVGREKQRARQEGRDVADKARIERAGNQPLAHDDMRLDQLHDDEREPLIVVQHGRHQAGRQPRLMRQRQIFVMRARQRQRPAFADEPHIGQRLLDGDAARGPLDDEHEVEVAVADLADRPGGRRAAKPGGDRREPCEVVPQIGLMKNSIFVLRGICQGSML